jgi:hypothetical protein
MCDFVCWISIFSHGWVLYVYAKVNLSPDSKVERLMMTTPERNIWKAACKEYKFTQFFPLDFYKNLSNTAFWLCAFHTNKKIHITYGLRLCLCILVLWVYWKQRTVKYRAKKDSLSQVQTINVTAVFGKKNMCVYIQITCKI